MDYHKRTTKLLAKVKHGRIALTRFRDLFPTISEQLAIDAQSTIFGAWGQSVNFDEHERKRIVDAKILSLLGRLAKFPIRDGNSYHAGLIHTYGYLFSQIRTQFGYKRDRWEKGQLEKILNIPDRVFAPAPENGTLLQNVSYFLARVAFQSGPADGSLTCIADSLREYPFRKLTVTRIAESVRLRRRVVELHTDLIRCSKASSRSQAVLVYSYCCQGKEQLITCFPVSASTETELTGQELSANTLVRPRFNLYLDGFTQPIAGQRKVFARKID